MINDFLFAFSDNLFTCDCGLLWMNRLAAETVNEQVKTALTEAKCQMNDTSEGGSDPVTIGTAPNRKTYAGLPDTATSGVGNRYIKYTGTKTTVDAKSPANGVDDYDTVYRVTPPSSNKVLTVRVSSLDEDTCPGKEQPLVDGAPDAAQNSDRVLSQSTKSSAPLPFLRPSTVLRSVFLPLWSSALLFAMHFHCH